MEEESGKEEGRDGAAELCLTEYGENMDVVVVGDRTIISAKILILHTAGGAAVGLHQETRRYRPTYQTSLSASPTTKPPSPTTLTHQPILPHKHQTGFHLSVSSPSSITSPGKNYSYKVQIHFCYK